MLYRQTGWGTERYDSREFEILRREWLGKLK
jgi:hypothetical protein